MIGCSDSVEMPLNQSKRNQDWDYIVLHGLQRRLTGKENAYMMKWWWVCLWMIGNVIPLSFSLTKFHIHVCHDQNILVCFWSFDVNEVIMYSWWYHDKKKSSHTVMELCWHLKTNHMVILLLKFMDLTRKISICAFYRRSMSLYCSVWTA